MCNAVQFDSLSDHIDSGLSVRLRLLSRLRLYYASLLCLSSSSLDAERVSFEATRLGFVRMLRTEEEDGFDWFPASFALSKMRTDGWHGGRNW